MTPLAELLAARIRASGPISLAEYMTECLLHPAHGYYATRDPFGRKGDFITAPEISQMFGELLGLCLAQYWLDLGRPAPFTLAECGPGRGTLMADVLRATARIPGFHDAAEVVLVEASATLRGIQAERLAPYAPRWRDLVQELPDQPLFLLANEFFDALPIRQFTRRATPDGPTWAETMVGLSPEGRLCAGLAPPGPLAALDHRQDVPEGGVVEICPTAAPIMTEIAGRIRRHGGLALIVDYGDWQSLGDTFQAIGNHTWTDPFAAPGEADLTAHVDFAALTAASQSGGPGIRAAWTSQGALLTALGIAARAAQLAAHPKAQANDPLAAARRLTDPAEMGTLFKALAIFASDAPPPAGFSTASSATGTRDDA